MITPSPDDFRAASRLTVALLDADSDTAAPELILVDDLDQACRTLFACAAIAAASVRAAASHDDLDQIGIGIQAVSERLASLAR